MFRDYPLAIVNNHIIIDDGQHLLLDTLDGLRPFAEELAAEINGVIGWEHPLTSARTD
jgi:hypothetical protein